MTATRKRYTAEFKREAVRLVQRPDVTRAQVAQELGLNANMLGRWVKQFVGGKWERTPGAALKSEQTQELDRLRRELRRVTMERDILKKAVAYFAKEPQ